MPELPAAIVSVLESEREALNARFQLRQRSGSQIDGEAFLSHVHDSIVPLATAVHAVFPERTRSTVMALYDVSLDLFAASLMGPEAKSPWLARVWSDLLPLTTKLLARGTQAVAGALCNAVHHIASQRGTRPENWLERMRAVLPRCESLRELLDAGKVAAWMAGMVQYRAEALTAASALRAEVAAAVLGLSVPCSQEELEILLMRLQKHRWLTAAEAARGDPQAALRCVAVAGAFTGFGGLFYRPPSVRTAGEKLLVADGVSQWQLLADAYGVWFFRIGDAPATAHSAKHEKFLEVDRQGTLRWGELSLATPAEWQGRSIPPLGDASSMADIGPTLAVTIPTSHHVFLFSRESIP